MNKNKKKKLRTLNKHCPKCHSLLFVVSYGTENKIECENCGYTERIKSGRQDQKDQSEW